MRALRIATDTPANIGKQYHFTRDWLQASITMTAGSATLGVVSLAMSSFPSNFDTFINSFDLIRFDEVQVTLRPHWNINSGTQALPLIAWVANYDDQIVPPTFDLLMGMNPRRFRTFDRPVTVKCTPPSELFITNSSVGNTMVLFRRWLNCQQVISQNINSPLMKYGIQAVATVPADGIFDIILKIRFTCAQPLMG